MFGYKAGEWLVLAASCKDTLSGFDDVFWIGEFHQHCRYCHRLYKDNREHGDSHYNQDVFEQNSCHMRFKTLETEARADRPVKT